MFQINQSVSILENRIVRPFTVFNYTVNGGTPFSVPGTAEALAWVKTKYPDPDDDWRRIFIFISQPVATSQMVVKTCVEVTV